MWLACDPDFGAIWRQHPDRNFQSPADRVDDKHRAISPLGPAQDFKSSGLEWVERIKDLNVRALRTQGIVSADATIHTSTASFPPAACLPTISTGFIRRAPPSSCP
jgi:hypothetical protein